MSAGIRFIEGFEGDEDSLVWEDMGLTRSADHARTGGFGIGITGLGSDRAQSPLFPSSTGVIVGFAFRWRAPTFGGNVAIFELRGPGDETHVRMDLDAQSLLSVYSPNESGD